MVRAPNPGAPQRVSAHVVPKASSSFAEEEDEKTTIESGWEEEASTTVEQGEVAEKIRSLGLDRVPMGTPATGEGRRQSITNVTSTIAGSTLVDEPTVDDQRANAALSMLTPPSIMARLVITMGNDTGQEIEIIPGKNYTIGRSIDNDVVLTDIAVSRKHFDLRHENGTWVLADRGSGNGTVVNGNLEDQPFMLANGDTIEIGNTTFKFDNPNGVPRNAFNDNGITNGFDESVNGVTRNAAQTYDVDLEEEEPSTVAGKPVRDVLGDRGLETPQQHHLPPRARPRTAPPPAPLPRPRTQSSMRAPTNPPLTYPNGSQGSLPASLQPTISPHQGMQAMPMPMPSSAYHGMAPLHPASRPMPILNAHQPTMLAVEAQQMPIANVMPTTIPGQGPPMHPSHPHIQQMPFTYPNVADHAQHAKLLVVQTGPNGRDSTAHVPPTPFGMHAMQPQPYAAPPISRRTKLLLGGAGLALLAAIATAAIIKGQGNGGGTAAVDETPPPPPKTGSAAPPKPVVQPIKEEPKKPDPKPIVVKEEPKKPDPDPKPIAVKEEPKKPDPKPIAVKEEPKKPDPKPIAV
ncbi:MAG: FHA domain-containing protein, partial [Kofleriaceae bacterium]